MDAVQKANSGHPGAPMGLAPVAYTLYTRVLRHNPGNPSWMNRDRFVLSAGHASMLLYSILYLTGYPLTLEDIEHFRRVGWPTPGHPEHWDSPGIEATTGPLGQGISMSVGLALAERMLAARFNRDGHDVVDHFTFTIASDGDMQEGVASEASSLAGHLGLGRLIAFYDDNKIQLAGPTSQSFSEDVGERFNAYEWHVQNVGEDLSPDATRGGGPRRDGGRGPPFADHRALAHRLWQPPQAGHLGGARFTAGRRRSPPHQGGLRLGSRQALLRARRGAGPLPPRMRSWTRARGRVAAALRRVPGGVPG